MIIGGILAGGLGTRMSSGGLPKQFLEIGGRPVIIRTLERFMNCDKIDRFVIAMNVDWMDYCHKMLNDYGVDTSKVDVITGGATRFESLLCIANFCQKMADEKGDKEVIMINHDCARPFVSDRIIRENLERIYDYDMMTTSIQTIDTIHVSKDGKQSDYVPDRTTIFLDQGPQTINVTHFLKLANELTEKEKETFIEAGRLYLEKGYRVGIVQGERENFKLTTTFDLKLAEMMLQEDDKNDARSINR